MKAQKEQAKKKTEAKATTKTKATEADEKQEHEGEAKSTTKSGLPEMLPMDILESVAQMEDSEESSSAGGSQLVNGGKKKHMRPEDFALMELEAELKAATQTRKKAEKTQKNVG